MMEMMFYEWDDEVDTEIIIYEGDNYLWGRWLFMRDMNQVETKIILYEWHNDWW